MAEVENHFTVFIRLPFKRGGFVDPLPVAWSAAKERALWDIMSRQSKNNEIDWRALADKFEVSQTFLLQQAAWLYERQLSQVRAQMRRVGNRQSATPSPAPGSANASMVGGQAMKRAGSGGSRVPSRLSTQALGSPVPGGGDSAPGTPAKSKASLSFRNVSGPPAAVASQSRTVSGSSRPISRQSSKEADAPVYAASSRRGSVQHQVARSPGPARNIQSPSSDSEEDLTQSRITARRLNPSSVHRRAVSLRKDGQPPRTNLAGAKEASQPQNHPRGRQEDQCDDDDEDSPSFLPFASPSPHLGDSRPRPSPPPANEPDPTVKRPSSSSHGQTHSKNDNLHGGHPTASDRVSSPIVEPPTPVQSQRVRQVSSTASPAPWSNPTRQPSDVNTDAPSTATARISHPLPPPHRALLRSPPRRPAPGSDTSPSMGSSFSDLDDASVTQSALEEALLSGMGNTTMTITSPGAGVAGRVSGISQALRSRYFDARGDGPSQKGSSGGGTER